MATIPKLTDQDRQSLWEILLERVDCTRDHWPDEDLADANRRAMRRIINLLREQEVHKS